MEEKGKFDEKKWDETLTGKVFNHPSKIDWLRVGIVIGAVSVVWAGLISIVPEKHHHVGTVILAALQSGVIFIMKSRKGNA